MSASVISRVPGGPAVVGIAADGPGESHVSLGSRRRDVWTPLSWAVLAAFVAYQGVVAFRAGNGPFLDEGIYITAGIRTLQGHGIGDGYLGWFAGSLLWPSIAGAAFLIGGLAGAKICAGLLVTAGLAGGMRATSVLFGPRAGFWATAVSAAGGPVLALGHLAVYDAVAVAGLGVCAMALTELAARDHRGWLLVAALALAVAVLGKYPAAFMTPIITMFLFTLRGRRAWTDLGLITVVFSAIMLAFFLPWRYQLAWFVQWRAHNNPAFGVSHAMVAYEQSLYLAVFVGLGCLGWFAARGARRLVTVMVAALLIFPAYHVAIGNSVSATKHDVFGIVLAMPAVGGGAAWLAGRKWWRQAVAALAAGVFLATGLSQAHRLDHGWVDARPGAGYLAAHMHPGDSLMVPNAWQILPYLLGRTVSDPTAVIDSYDLLNVRQDIDLCRVDWIVNTENDNSWPTPVTDRMRRCGTFVEVFRSHSNLINLGPDFRYVTYRGSFVIYQNTAGQR